MGAFFSALIGKAGIYLVLVTVCLIALAVVARNWSCKKQREPRPPKIVTLGPYRVLNVPTGANIEVSTGRRDKRTTTIHLQYVQAPATGEWASVSADHLRDMAGPEITVQCEKHGLFRGTDEEAQDSQRLEEGLPLTVEAADRMGWKKVICEECNGTGFFSDVQILICPLCDGKGCDECGNTGSLALDFMTIAKIQLWMSKHIDMDKCGVCKDGLSCPVADTKIKEILSKRDKGYIPQKIECFACEGKGYYYIDPVSAETVKSRPPLTGIVFGASGTDEEGYQDSQRRLEEECEATTAEAPATANEIGCPICDGQGVVPAVRNMVDECFDFYPPPSKCRSCNGTGRVDRRLVAAAWPYVRHEILNDWQPTGQFCCDKTLVCAICRYGLHEYLIHSEATPGISPENWYYPIPDTMKKHATTEALAARDESEAFAKAVLGPNAVKIAEARSPIIGIVSGASGINLNLAQVGGGYASVTTDAPAEFQEAQKKAEKLKLGIWSKGK